MNLGAFDRLSDQASLWIYGFEQPLHDDTRAVVERKLDAFMPTWNTHGVPVRAAYTIACDRFVLIAGESEDGVSGCSIDSCVRNFKELRDEHSIDALNRGIVFFRNEANEVTALDRAAFQVAIDDGRVTGATIVFDLTLRSLGDLRAGRLERAFSESWHARAFRRGDTAQSA